MTNFYKLISNKFYLITSFIFIFYNFIQIAFAEQLIIVSHRGGRGDFPENTMYAFKESEKLDVDYIELDIQLTSDNIPVVYHPATLAKHTNLKGRVKHYTLKQIRDLTKIKGKDGRDDYDIPTLNEVLTSIKKPLILDLKALPSKPLVIAVAKLVEQKNAWDRVLFYSTNKEHIEYLEKNYNKARLFEPRYITRGRGLNVILNNECKDQSHFSWVGFERVRKMTVEEKFALGKGSSDFMIEFWQPKTINCFNKQLKHPKIIIFGVNDLKDFCAAYNLKPYGIYTDYPKLMVKFRNDIKKNSSLCNTTHQ